MGGTILAIIGASSLLLVAMVGAESHAKDVYIIMACSFFVGFLVCMGFVEFIDWRSRHLKK